MNKLIIVILLVLICLGGLSIILYNQKISGFIILESNSNNSFSNDSPEFMRNGEWKNIIFDKYLGEK